MIRVQGTLGSEALRKLCKGGTRFGICGTACRCEQGAGEGDIVVRVWPGCLKGLGALIMSVFKG